MANVEAPEMLSIVRACLRDIGYQDDLVIPNYTFRDFFYNGTAKNRASCQIELAAFAQMPHSIRSACFGVTMPSSATADAIIPLRALGAPQILALHPQNQTVHRWKIMSAGEPQLIDEFSFSHIVTEFQRKKGEWGPTRILSAKTLAFVDGSPQFDFMDFGLLPALEAELRPKLSRDIQNIIVRCRNVYEQWHSGDSFDSILAPLFRLIFRLIAAKMLIDRDNKPEWQQLDAASVIHEVEAFYFPQEQSEPALLDQPVQNAAWEQVRKGLNLQNLSPETLAYVYENAFVTEQVRRRLGVHATPPEVAEYVVRQLPVEQLNWKERTVFEPFTGSAPFLLAAMGRLRELLPENLSASERHDYFVSMLCGIERDPFAREIARYSLILADYPNPNGWRVNEEDAFRGATFDTYLHSVNIVLCNPPHEDFASDERHDLPEGASVNKAAEALRRVLAHPPRLLGFVLPRSFLDRAAFQQLRQEIATHYRNISVTVLPDKTFKKASQEIALLIADNVRNEEHPYSYASVSAKDYAAFFSTDKPSFRKPYSALTMRDNDVVLWQTPLQSVWEELAHCSQL